MLTVTYWVAARKNGDSHYSIRAKTKEKCEKLRDEYGKKDYASPKRVVIQYIDAFDLIDQALGEGGLEHYEVY